MNCIKMFALIISVVIGASVTLAQDGLDTISFREVFHETYTEFTNDHAVWVEQSRTAWTYPDSLKYKHRTIDSVYFEKEGVTATVAILQYENDILKSFSFFLSINEDEKFLRVLKKGAFARLGRQGKRQRFKSDGDRYYFYRNLHPANAWREAEFSYKVFTERVRKKN